MMMQMLDAGGLDCLGSPEKGDVPWYEDKRSAPIGVLDEGLLKEAEGKAFKLLEPSKRPLPFVPDEARFIWMDRQRKHQAVSYIKMMVQIYGMPINKRTLERRFRQLKGSELKTARKMSLAVLEKYGKPVLKVRFEDVLSKPLEVSERVAEFTGAELDINAMVKVIQPRGKECFDGMMEDSLR